MMGVSSTSLSSLPVFLFFSCCCRWPSLSVSASWLRLFAVLLAGLSKSSSSLSKPKQWSLSSVGTIGAGTVIGLQEQIQVIKSYSKYDLLEEKMEKTI